MSNKERLQAIGRMLYVISAAARYYSLQAKNQQSEVLARALPEMRDLLREYESLVEAQDGQPGAESPSVSSLPSELALPAEGRTKAMTTERSVVHHTEE